jgi:hypothetical protein
MVAPTKPVGTLLLANAVVPSAFSTALSVNITAPPEDALALFPVMLVPPLRVTTELEATARPPPAPRVLVLLVMMLPLMVTRPV